MKNPIGTRRHIHRYDTVRCLLIFLVVAAHILEYMGGETVKNTFRIIYSFHMPAFIFITGKMARFDKRKIIRHLIVPYLIFQPLFILFHRRVYGEDMELQFTVPYWLLWYLLTIIIFYILIPMLPRKGSRWVIPALVISVLGALGVGYMDNVGYYMSLARVFYFFPFFIWGYYYDTLLLKKGMENKLFKWGMAAACLIMILFGEKYICNAAFPNTALYGAYSYSASTSTIIDRMIIMLTAAAWILLLENLIPDVKIPLVSTIGQNTMPIYLFHGFIIRYAYVRGFFQYISPSNLLLVCEMSLALLLLFGSRYVGRLFRIIF